MHFGALHSLNSLGDSLLKGCEIWEPIDLTVHFPDLLGGFDPATIHVLDLAEQPLFAGQPFF